MRRLAVALLFGFAWLALAAPSSIAYADDGRPAAIMPFGGAQKDAVRKRVYNKLKRRGVRLVPLKKTSKAAIKGRKKSRVIRALRASLLVSAKISKKGKKLVANVQLHDGKRRLKTFRASASGANALADEIAKRLIRTRLMPMPKKTKDKPIVKKLDGGVEPSPYEKAKPEPPPAARPEKEKGPPRLVIRPFRGKNASRVRTSAVRSLKRPSVVLVPNKKFTGAARRLGADLRSETGHVRPAEVLGVSALVEGEIEYEDGFWSAYLRLVDGHSEKVLTQVFFEGETLGALSRSVQRGLWSGFAGDIRKLKRWKPMKIETVDRTPPKVADDTRSEAEKRRARDERRHARRIEATNFSALDIEFAFRLFRRKLTYNDDLGGDLRGYQLGLGPGIALRLQWYPGAHASAGVAAMFGIDFEYERMFKVNSSRADGTSFPTESQAFDIGLRWRYPLRKVEPSLIAAFGVHEFKLQVVRQPGGGAPLESDVPGVKYRFGRFGADVRISLPARLSLRVGGAFLWVFSLGGIEAAPWFPDASGNGIEATLKLGYGLPKGFEVRFGVDYRRYFMDLNPIPPSPPFVAGGALDQYWGFDFAVAWRD